MCLCPIDQTKSLVQKADLAHTTSPFHHQISANDLVTTESIAGLGFRLKEPFGAALTWGLEKTHNAIKESGGLDTQTLASTNLEVTNFVANKFEYLSTTIPRILHVNFLLDPFFTNPLLLAYPTVKVIRTVVEDLQKVGREAVDWASRGNRVLREMEEVFGVKSIEWNRSRLAEFGVGDFGGAPETNGWGTQSNHSSSASQLTYGTQELWFFTRQCHII